jgi:hypothetical protein
MVARQFGAKPEARKAVRRFVDLDCDVYTDLWGEAISHRVTDVSEEGLWIQTELLLDVGTEVTLTFYPPDWDEPLCVAGRVQRVELRARSGGRNAVGMGIEFETLRADERRRLTSSMRCFRAEESFILGKRTLCGVPVGVGDSHEAPTQPHGTVVGWTAPCAVSRPKRITAKPAPSAEVVDQPKRAFGGGLDLATSVFAPHDSH